MVLALILAAVLFWIYSEYYFKTSRRKKDSIGFIFAHSFLIWFAAFLFSLLFFNNSQFSSSSHIFIYFFLMAISNIFLGLFPESLGGIKRGT